MIYNINNLYNNIYNNYNIIDIETNLITKEFSIYKQSPKFILGGVLRKDSISRQYRDITQFRDDIMAGERALVGHNISYDIIVTASQDKHFRDYVLNNHRLFIWDTAVCEYMLSGQTKKYPSLKDSAIHNNLQVSKDDEVSEMMKAGIDPETILEVNPELLERYLNSDLLVTEALFSTQLEVLKSFGKALLNLILQRQWFLLNTIRMSITGMPFDVVSAKDESEVLSIQVKALKDSIEATMAEVINSHTSGNLVPQAEEDDYFLHTMEERSIQVEPANCNSNPQLLAVFFGGDVEVSCNGVTGVYKTGARKGEPKYKTVRFSHKIPGFLPFTRTSLDDATLSEIAKGDYGKASELAKTLREYRTLTKKLGTYYEPYIAACKDGRIHCDYNHTATPTGRITASKPNLQNVEGD